MASILIRQVELYNILGIDDVKLAFNNFLNPIFVVISGSNCPITKAFSNAMELIFSAQYETIESLASFNNIDKGSIRVVMHVANKYILSSGLEIEIDNAEEDNLPTTSQKALEKLERQRELLRNRKQITIDARAAEYVELEVCRNFALASENVFYSIDGSTLYNIPIAEFHSRFSSSIGNILPNLQEFQEKFPDNLAEATATDLNGESPPGLMNPLRTFMQLFITKSLSENHIVSRLTQSCVTMKYAIDVVHRSELQNILRTIRSIFDYITSDEYSVWFFVPIDGTYVDLETIKNEYLQLDEVAVFLQLRSVKESEIYIFKDADYVIRELLVIAFQIAIGLHCKRAPIYLRRMKGIKEYQNVKVASTLFYNRQQQQSMTQTRNIYVANYLARILHVCQNLNLTAIIEYPGGIGDEGKDINVLRCVEDQTTKKWTLQVE